MDAENLPLSLNIDDRRDENYTVNYPSRIQVLASLVRGILKQPPPPLRHVDTWTGDPNQQYAEPMDKQFFMPREQDAAGNFPAGYFGDRMPSGTPYPRTMYSEMEKQTVAAQQAPTDALGQMLRYNPAALQRFMAGQPASTNIDDRRGEMQPDRYGPEPEIGPVGPQDIDPASPMARALGYGALIRPTVPLPRPRPR